MSYPYPGSNRSSTPSNSSLFSGRNSSTAPSTASSAAWARAPTPAPGQIVPPQSFARAAHHANPYMPMLPSSTLASLSTASLDVHPVLRPPASPYDSAPRLDWDVRAPVSHILVRQGGQAVPSPFLQLPATAPPTATLYILMRGLPWTITVQSPNPTQPITCQMLLEAIYTAVRAPVTALELNTLWSPQSRAMILQAYRTNREDRGMPQDICRADALGSAIKFAGVRFDEAHAREHFNVQRQDAGASTARTVVLSLAFSV